MLAALPTLLEVARAMLLTGFGPGQDAADDLRVRIEACAVDAHRLLLGRRLEQLRGCNDDVEPDRS